MKKVTIHWPTDEELEVARRRGERRLAQGPLATSVRYDQRTDRVVVELNNGAALVIPRRLMQGLESATPAQMRKGAIWGDGLYLEWDALDAQFLVRQLLRGVFGSPTWMSELARHAGSQTSPAKAAAARRNGAKGGRPRKAS